VILLVNGPVPGPSFVFVLRATVGFGLVLQMIPFARTGNPPSESMFPLKLAVDAVIVPVVIMELIDGDVEQITTQVSNANFFQRTFNSSIENLFLLLFEIGLVSLAICT
jgi:hypothetical protein